MASVRTVTCPHCGKVVEWSPASVFRPFCSKRCKDIDLAAWASESYRVPVVETDDDDDSGKPVEERD
jgi:endogenous inhibitor of DNA gyrase (YacG/DUF329 family)